MVLGRGAEGAARRELEWVDGWACGLEGMWKECVDAIGGRCRWVSNWSLRERAGRVPSFILLVG